MSSSDDKLDAARIAQIKANADLYEGHEVKVTILASELSQICAMALGEWTPSAEQRSPAQTFEQWWDTVNPSVKACYPLNSEGIAARAYAAGRQSVMPSHALRSESPLAWLVFVEDHPEGWDYMVFANEDDAERQAANEATNHPDGKQPEVVPLYRGSAFTKSATASGWSKADWFSQPIHTIYVQPETTHIRQRRQGAPDDVYEMALPPLPDRPERTVKE